MSIRPEIPFLSLRPARMSNRLRKKKMHEREGERERRGGREGGREGRERVRVMRNRYRHNGER